MEKNENEVVIIGGSYAGLSAGLALGRAMRRVTIVDGGQPCNRSTPHSHNFLTQDGQTPAAISELAISQVLAYPTVGLMTDTVTSITGFNRNFVIETASGNSLTAQKLLFATGIKDQLPAIPGFEDCWGKSIIHCPYCHGYEYRHQVTGILANGEMAFESGRLINNWTKKLTILTNGKSTINADHSQRLKTAGIVIDDRVIGEFIHESGQLKAVRFSDESTMLFDAIYAKVAFKQHCDIPAQLGCAINEQGYLLTDDFQRTNIDGIYAAGDAVSMLRSVSTAVATGTRAGAFINHATITE